MKLFFTLLFTLTLGIFTANGQATKAIESKQKINKYLTELEKVGLNGSVLVAMNGEMIISKGYGFSDQEKKIYNTPKSLFDIGSITKQFTATAILKLEMQGKLSTDDSLAKYFDQVPADKANITLHDLLRHQSGLTSNVGGDFEKINNEEFLNKVFSSPLKFETGSNFYYSNIGYSLLAMIIEKVSGQDYEAYCYEYLWKPAKMEMTGYSRPAFDPSLISNGYYQDDSLWGKPTDKEWDQNAPYWHLKGNGGILSTTEDMYRWHTCLMTDLVLSKEAKQKLYHPKLRKEEDENTIYAYGWDVSTTNRKTTQVWHNGSNRILYADFLRFIDEDITMIFLTNKSHPNFNNVCFHISKIIFNPNFTPIIPIADNKENRTFTIRILKTLEEGGLEKAKEELSLKKKSEQLLIYIMRDEGFNQMDNGNGDLALQILELNAFAHPKSAESIQWLGEGYMETGKKELAIKYFKESLSLNSDNRWVNDRIKELEDTK